MRGLSLKILMFASQKFKTIVSMQGNRPHKSLEILMFVSKKMANIAVMPQRPITFIVLVNDEWALWHRSIVRCLFGDK